MPRAKKGKCPDCGRGFVFTDTGISHEAPSCPTFRSMGVPTYEAWILGRKPARSRQARGPASDDRNPPWMGPGHVTDDPTDAFADPSEGEKDD